MKAEITVKMYDATNGEFRAIILNESGKVEAILIRCNRATFVAALKKAGYGNLIPRGFASQK